MDYAPQISYERSKIRPTADESKSQWLAWQDAKLYLLPVVARQQKVVPTFNDDGTVSVEIAQQDQELTPLLASFFNLVATYQAGERSLIFADENVYTGFFRLVRKLLLV